jgi:hypothetical protein
MEKKLPTKYMLRKWAKMTDEIEQVYGEEVACSVSGCL